jgi:putative ABC transport system ATP-binding protein
LIGALDIPTSGTIFAFNIHYASMGSHERGVFRRKTIGFVFQELSLIPHLTALENVTVPVRFDGLRSSKLLELGQLLLHEVGLDRRSDHFPHELSYGERQRVAIARALAREPTLLLFDEPTANLDTANVMEVRRLLDQCRARGSTIVAATHDERLEEGANRTIHIDSGRIVSVVARRG